MKNLRKVFLALAFIGVIVPNVDAMDQGNQEDRGIGATLIVLRYAHNHNVTSKRARRDLRKGKKRKRDERLDANNQDIVKEPAVRKKVKTTEDAIKAGATAVAAVSYFKVSGALLKALIDLGYIVEYGPIAGAWTVVGIGGPICLIGGTLYFVSNIEAVQNAVKAAVPVSVSAIQKFKGLFGKVLKELRETFPGNNANYFSMDIDGNFDNDNDEVNV